MLYLFAESLLGSTEKSVFTEFGRVVVVGGGYAGLRATLALEEHVGKHIAYLTMVDRYPFHQLITWLHRGAVGSVDPRLLRIPFSDLLDRYRVDYLQAEVQRIDLASRQVLTSRGRLSYDRLILSPGSDPEYYGIPGLAEHCFPFRNWSDMQRLREHLDALAERIAAARPGRDLESLLTFVIGGGGYTGCELACELASALREQRRWHLPLPPRVILVEARPQVMPTLDDELRKRALVAMRRLSVDVRVNCAVVGAEAGRVSLSSGDVIEAATVIWSGGIRGPRFLQDSGLAVSKSGQALVNGHLEADGHPEVQVIGDAARVIDPETRLPVAPSAQLAIQEAELAARNLVADATGRGKMPFIPEPLGEIVTLGPRDAVAQANGVRISGLPAALLEEAATERYLYSLGGLGLALGFAQKRTGVKL